MSIKINFGIHLGFAINRYPDPQSWARLIGDEVGVRHVQFVSDLLQPTFNDEIIDEQIENINRALADYDLKTLHTFTSPRWNYLAHPNEKIRKYWFDWLVRWADISARIGAISTGSLLGIYSVDDFQSRRQEVFVDLVKYWHLFAEHAKKAGLQYLTWEPMSIGRELGETISETRRIDNALNFGEIRPVAPILMCLDVDHGDVMSSDPRDLDPYAWLETFGARSPCIQMKQRSKNVYGHKPFTSDHNKEGVIFPERVIESLESAGVEEVTIYLELSFREREPYDSQVVKDIRASVDFWRPYL